LGEPDWNGRSTILMANLSAYAPFQILGQQFAYQGTWRWQHAKTKIMPADYFTVEVFNRWRKNIFCRFSKFSGREEIMQDQEIIEKIGGILLGCSPENAMKIIVRAEIPPENNAGLYEFDYIDENGCPDWFDPDVRAVSDLTVALVEYKVFLLENNLTSGKPIWNKCEITMDVPRQEIRFDFQYEK
ncbi:hypothetical protein, partial [Bordetella sp. LUAb4]|uniref:hypothetical protein n=1 Tax=Bordetella sp. LUAb4 TaxID=2843195 RepID=UPI001E602816